MAARAPLKEEGREATSLAVRDDAPLAGAQRSGATDRLKALWPLAAVLAASTTLSAPWLMLALLAAVAVGAKVRRGRSDATGAGGRELLRPQDAVALGAHAFAVPALLKAAWWMTGSWGGMLAFLILWPALTGLAVMRAARTDVQSGWIAGASSLTGVWLYQLWNSFWWGAPHWPLLAVASVSTVGLIWKFLGARGHARSMAALGAAGAASITALMVAGMRLAQGFHVVAATYVVTALMCIALPVMMNRSRLAAARRSVGDEERPQLLSSED